MKGTWYRHRLGRCAFLVLALAFFSPKADAQVFVCYRHAGIVNEYDIDTGALIKEGLISGLQEPRALCLDNGCLFILEQDAGTVLKYDALTGTPLKTPFISSFNHPEAMAVSDGALFVASFEWPFQRNEFTDPGNVIGKYDATTGASINATFLKSDWLPPSLFAHNHKLFVPGATAPNGPVMFDANTGAPLPHNRYSHFLVDNSVGLAAQDEWLWITPGQRAPLSFVLKYNIETGQSAADGDGPITPFIVKVPHPGMIAVSGDDLIISTGAPGSVHFSKYNAATGELIKDDFIVDHSDDIVGIAAIPRPATPVLTLDRGVFTARNMVGGALFWAYTNGDTVYLFAAILFFLVILGLMTFLHYYPIAATNEPSLEAGEEPIPQPAAVAPAPVEAAPADLPESPASTHTFGTRTVFASVLVVFALIAVSLAYIAFHSFDFTRGPRGYPADLIGIWGNDTTDRDLGPRPEFYQVEVYPTHVELSGTCPLVRLEGQWHDDGFWCPKPDGSGEVEVCKLTDPLDLECHLSAFLPGNDEVKSLYKLHGSDAEMKALAAKYPGPITYPPPADTITFWMPEYELKNLPWQCDHIILPDDEPYSRSVIYVYRSDNPGIQPLLVTVKNHRVVKAINGNPNDVY